jgi:hypothetical protein
MRDSAAEEGEGRSNEGETPSALIRAPSTPTDVHVMRTASNCDPSCLAVQQELAATIRSLMPRLQYIELTTQLKAASVHFAVTTRAVVTLPPYRLP